MLSSKFTPLIRISDRQFSQAGLFIETLLDLILNLIISITINIKLTWTALQTSLKKLPQIFKIENIIIDFGNHIV